MADRYWVGGSGTWSSANTANWSASSGGPSGASVPTSADSVFFDQAATYTVTLSGSLSCLDLTVSAGTVTFAVSGTPSLSVFGSFTLIAGTVFSCGTLNFSSTTTGRTITTNGVTITLTNFSLNFSGSGGGWTLGSALTTTGTINLIRGTLNTANYNVTMRSFDSNVFDTRSLILGSSTVTLTTANWLSSTDGTFTFNAGTSTVVLQSSTGGVSAPGLAFNNLSFTTTGGNTTGFLRFASCNNLTITPPSAATFPRVYTVNGDLTINGVFSTTAGSAIQRLLFQSLTLGTTRTITINSAPSISDIDFQDIAVVGTAAPISGTRIGDCKGNSGITFDTPKTVYWNGLSGSSWLSNSWGTSSGGGVVANSYPLAQDTAVIDNAAPSSGGSISLFGFLNLGNIDMSARTNGVTISFTTTTGVVAYGNWTNGAGTFITRGSSGFFTFGGRGAQSITSAGRTFGTSITINSPGGTVTLQDALNIGTAGTEVLNLIAGTLNANNYNVSIFGSFLSNAAATRTLALGSGTWTITGASGWNTGFTTGLTVTGSGTISMSRAAGITFQGGGIKTWPTINQGSSGALLITGSNKFQDITNTFAATGATTVRFAGGTTNEFVNFNLTGQATRVCTLTSNTTTQARLRKSTPWLMGANSTDSGNNTNLLFTAGGGIDYLNVSYINGLGNDTSGFLVFFI